MVGALGLTGVVDGARLRHSSALPDVDVVLESRMDGLKEDLVLGSAAAPDRYVFPLILEGLTASIDDTGAVVYRDESGAERLRTPAGWMEDANVDPHVGDGQVSRGVSYAIVPFGLGVALEVQLDRAWLDDPARVYPVTVDPSFQVYTAYDDTYVQRTVSGVRHDSETELRVGTYDSGTNIVRSFLHYDFSPISGKTIDSATMYLWNFHSWECNTPRYVDAYRVTQGWDGAMTAWPGVAFDGQPIASSSFGYGNGCASGWGTWNIRDAVANWTAGVWPNEGVMLGTNESNNFYWKKFASRNSCSCEGAGSTGPHVDVQWSEPASGGQSPFGSLDLTSPGYQQVRVGGWALDPDTNASIQVDVWLDGSQYLGGTMATGYRPDVDAVYHRGAYHGFDATFDAPAGTHQVCAWAINAPGTGGSHAQFGCSTVTIAVDTWPYGSYDSASAGYEQVYVAGWAIDNDDNNYQVLMDVRADGAYLGTLTAGQYRPDVHAIYGQGAYHGFSGWLAAPAGTRSICIYANNSPTTSRNYNNFGCRTVTILAKTPPSAPQSVSATAGARSAAVTWNAPSSDGGAAVSGYLVRAYLANGTPAGVEKTTPVGQRAALVDGLADDTAYYFNVYALNSKGYSPPGTSNTVTTAALASTLTGQLVAQSDELGLEQYQAYARHDLGATDAFVQLRTGNLVVQQRDARVPGQGLNVVVRRTYNSQDTKDNGLGAGWRLSVSDLDAGLEGADGAVTDLDPTSPLGVADIVSVVGNAAQVTGRVVDFTDGDGTTHRFVRTGPLGRRWDSPPGVSLRLREVTGTGGVVTAYELIRPDGVVYRVENLQGPLGLPTATWLVKTVTDRNGNRLTYEYTTVTVGGVAKARLSTITHNRTPNQAAVALAWTGPGNRLSSITALPGAASLDPATNTSRSWQRLTNFTYTSGRLTDVVQNETKTADEGLRTFGFRYDANGMLDQLTDPRGNPSGLGYTLDAGVRRLTSITDRRTKVWGYVYNALDPTTGERATTATSPVGAVTTYRTTGRGAVSANDARVAGGNIVSITDSGNNAGAVTTSYSWLENRLVTKTDGAGNATSMTYNDLGLLTKVTEPKPNRDDRTDLTLPDYPKTTIDSKLGYTFVSAYRYPDCTEPAPGGPAVTKVGYCDAVADMSQVVAADNIATQRRVTDFGLDPSGNGNVRTVTQRGTGGDPDRTTSFDYYGRGGLCSVNGPRTDVNDVTRYGDTLNIGAACGAGPDPLYGGYDPTGLAPRIRDAALKAKDIAYTPYGMVAKVTDRDARITRTRYDERENPIEVTDPQNRVTTSSYNANDQVAVATSARGTATTGIGNDFETRYTYDPNGWLTKVSRPDATDTDPAKRVETSTAYNDDGTKASDTNAAGGVTTYSYWPNRSLKQTSAPAATAGPAALTDFEYDLAGRITRTVFPATNTAGTQRPETIVDYTPPRPALHPAGDVSARRAVANHAVRIQRPWRGDPHGRASHGRRRDRSDRDRRQRLRRTHPVSPPARRPMARQRNRLRHRRQQDPHHPTDRDRRNARVALPLRPPRPPLRTDQGPD